MSTLKLLSLCSGIGGIDLAAQVAGFEIAGQVEIDPFCQEVLAKHWPDIPRMNDIKEVRGDEFGAIDIVAGGIPCQPFSIAGKRRGQEDDRNLWPFAFAIIQRCNPTWVLIENVAHFVNMALDTVQTDLETRGYETRALVLPACAVGAPHIRERCFIVAHAQLSTTWLEEYRGSGQGREHPHVLQPTLLRQEDRQVSTKGIRAASHPTMGGMADPSSKGLSSEWNGRDAWTHNATGSCSEDMAYTAEQRLQIGGYPGLTTGGTQARAGMESELERCSQGVGLADTYSQGLSVRNGSTATRGTCTTIDRCRTGQPQSQLCRGSDGLPSELDMHQWPALPGQEPYEWEPARTVTGRQPYRNQRLKALGNAVVPQQIYPILKAIADIEMMEREEVAS